MTGALAEMRRLAREHGIFVGPSSGAHMLAAQRLRRERPELGVIVTLFCDEGEKYSRITTVRDDRRKMWRRSPSRPTVTGLTAVQTDGSVPQ